MTKDIQANQHFLLQLRSWVCQLNHKTQEALIVRSKCEMLTDNWSSLKQNYGKRLLYFFPCQINFWITCESNWTQNISTSVSDEHQYFYLVFNPSYLGDEVTKREKNISLRSSHSPDQSLVKQHPKVGASRFSPIHLRVKSSLLPSNETHSPRLNSPPRCVNFTKKYIAAALGFLGHSPTPPMQILHSHLCSQ